ncbi:hypothetical protein Bphy_3113 [Paraburkholderia phymatum STM815]|uniref:Uncharacterized protein n=1 Tax=Paraburkholderia phymatum (strain DSM 17167 / CIP 108236 / LMG 21445 / STM815) TaxID=391038 RepID=B2JR55_PARP8|nr:hypothetical protein Bphy_3113 [Paraburkholderia phymatum STM815]
MPRVNGWPLMRLPPFQGGRLVQQLDLAFRIANERALHVVAPFESTFQRARESAQQSHFPLIQPAYDAFRRCIVPDLRRPKDT